MDGLRAPSDPSKMSTLNLVDLAQILGMIAMTTAFGFWGGQITQMMKVLTKQAEDHEARLRTLETGCG